MFRLSNYFFKETLVAFYRENDDYFVQKRVIKNKKIISEEELKLDENELIDFIKSCFIENTQTYISTMIDTFNQGCVDSCSHSKYKELGINIDNIKILCLKDYSIFIGVYELNNYIKEMKKFKVDFIFSPYLIIDTNKKKLKNTLYILYTNTFIAVMIYEDERKPKYSNIYQLKSDEENQEEKSDNIDSFDDDFDDDINLVDDIEELEDLDDALDDDIGDIDDIDEISDVEDENIQEEILDVKNEIESVEFIKNSIKDYYESYSDNFLENGYIFYNNETPTKFIQNLETEILLEIKSEFVDILSIINQLSLKDIDDV